jgi:hypothetical protein
VIEKLAIGQGGSSDFSAGTRDIARGKDRSEDEKYEVKLTPAKTNFSITSGISFRAVAPHRNGLTSHILCELCEL